MYTSALSTARAKEKRGSGSATKLKPYQERFVRETLEKALSGGIVDWSALNIGLFADMGTGKTPATILLLEWLRKALAYRGAPEARWPILLVVPAAVKWNWRAEIERFAPWVEPRDVTILDGTRQKRLEQLAQVLEERPRFVICNYETIRAHRRWFQDHPGFLCVVVDEAHAIKNREAKRTVAIKAIESKCRMALTGTPITNKPDDLWSILHFIDPGPGYTRTVWMWKRGQKRKEIVRYRQASPEWGSYWSFAERYCRWQQSRSGSRIIGGRNLAELNQRLYSTGVMTRWRRSEVLSLEPIVYEYVTLSPTPEQARLYRQLAQGYVAYVEAVGRVDSRRITGLLAQLTYFRRATTLTPREFALAIGNHKPVFTPDLQIAISDQGAKQQWLLQFLKSAQLHQHKVLIFSDWTDCIRPLMKRLRRHHIKAVHIDGSTSHRQRYEVQERFNSDDEVRVFLGSPAAYEGLNLQAASYVVFMNLPWRPKDVFQAYSRCHRMGQEKQVTVIFPIIGGTIDIQMANRLREKQRDIDLAIDRGEVNAARLFEVTTKQQVLNMIGDGWQ